MSCQMFDKILENNKEIREELVVQGDEIDFIKQQINGTKKEDRKPYCNNEKDFLYEIVANKRNGVDVDKWDYLARDHYYLGLPCAFDTHIMDHVRALEVEVDRKKEYMICTRDIKAESVYNMFQTRRRLHSVALHHRVVNAINFMICDAFVLAKDDLRYGNGRTPLAQCIEDPEAFLHLTDDVYYELLRHSESQNENLRKASEIIQRIEKRDIYPCVGNNIVQKVPGDSQMSHDDVKKEIKDHWNDFIKAQADFKDHAADFHLHVVIIDFGKGLQDPVSGNMWFYKKPKPGENVDRATQLSRERISSMLPSQFSEYLVRLYCKYSTKETTKIDKAKMLFTKWRDAFNVQDPSQLQLHSIYCDEDNETRDQNST